MKLFKTFHLFMLFFQKKDEDLCQFPVRDLPVFLPKISHTPGGFRLYSLDADGRISPWKHRGLVVPKVWWLSTVGCPKPTPTLPGTITYHHISQPWKLGGTIIDSKMGYWRYPEHSPFTSKLPIANQLLVPATYFDLQSYDTFWYMRYMLGLPP